MVLLIMSGLHSIAQCFVQQIKEDREGKPIDRILLKAVIDMFVELSMHQKKFDRKAFESFMLSQSSTYYSLKL